MQVRLFPRTKVIGRAPAEWTLIGQRGDRLGWRTFFKNRVCWQVIRRSLLFIRSWDNCYGNKGFLRARLSFYHRMKIRSQDFWQVRAVYTPNANMIRLHRPIRVSNSFTVIFSRQACTRRLTMILFMYFLRSDILQSLHPWINPSLMPWLQVVHSSVDYVQQNSTSTFRVFPTTLRKHRVTQRHPCASIKRSSGLCWIYGVYPYHIFPAVIWSASSGRNKRRSPAWKDVGGHWSRRWPYYHHAIYPVHVTDILALVPWASTWCVTCNWRRYGLMVNFTVIVGKVNKGCSSPERRWW